MRLQFSCLSRFSRFSLFPIIIPCWPTMPDEGREKPRGSVAVRREPDLVGRAMRSFEVSVTTNDATSVDEFLRGVSAELTGLAATISGSAPRLSAFLVNLQAYFELYFATAAAPTAFGQTTGRELQTITLRMIESCLDLVHDESLISSPLYREHVQPFWLRVQRMVVVHQTNEGRGLAPIVIGEALVDDATG
jgi:hypothetical protein